MTFIFDLIDIKWFIDNFGETLNKLLDAIGKLFQDLFNGKAEEESTQADA